MGRRRLGHSRLEKLFEGLTRDLNMSGGTISGSPTCTLGATTLSSTLTYASGLKGNVPILTTSTPTTLSAATTLAVNTVYRLTDTDTAVYALPAQSDSTAGDWIQVQYHAILADGEIHDYGTSTEMFAATSILFKASNAANAQVWTVDVADGASDDYIKLTGATNGGCGVGTTLTFCYNGSAWQVEAWIYSQGAGSVAVTAAFAGATG